LASDTSTVATVASSWPWLSDAEAHGLGAFQRVRGRSDGHVDRARHQGGDPLGEGGFHDFGGHAKRGGQVVAIVDVEADWIVVGIPRPHGREVQHDRAAENAGGDDVVKLVGLRRQGQRGGRKQASSEERRFHVFLPWVTFRIHLSQLSGHDANKSMQKYR
jgi:hypothetical protein